MDITQTNKVEEIVYGNVIVSPHVNLSSTSFTYGTPSNLLSSSGLGYGHGNLSQLGTDDDCCTRRCYYEGNVCTSSYNNPRLPLVVIHYLEPQVISNKPTVLA